MNPNICSSIIVILDALKKQGFKNDRRIAETINLNTSAISKIRNYQNYQNIFDDDYLNRVKNDLEKLIIKPQGEKLYFILYRYILPEERRFGKEEIGVALLALEFIEGENQGFAEYWTLNLSILRNKEIQAEIMGFNTDKEAEELLDKKLTLFYWNGERISLDTGDFIQLKKYFNKKTSTENPLNIAQIVMFRGLKNNYDGISFSYGSYSTTKNGYPVSGTIIIQKINDTQTPLKKALQEIAEPIHPNLTLELRGKRSLADYMLMKTLDMLPSNQLSQVLGRASEKKGGYAGMYRFYTYSKKDGYVGKFAMWLKEDGTLTINTRLREYKGVVELSYGNHLHFKVSSGNNPYRSFDFIVRYERNNQDKLAMKGVYSGLYDNAEIGRTYLIQKDTWLDLVEKDNNEDHLKDYFQTEYVNKMTINHDIPWFIANFPEIAAQLEIENTN